MESSALLRSLLRFVGCLSLEETEISRCRGGKKMQSGSNEEEKKEGKKKTLKARLFAVLSNGD